MLIVEPCRLSKSKIPKLLATSAMVIWRGYLQFRAMTKASVQEFPLPRSIFVALFQEVSLGPRTVLEYFAQLMA